MDGFSSESSALPIIGDDSPKGAHAIQKNDFFFRIFGNFREFLRILELFSGKFRKVFDVIFRELCS